MVKGLALSLVPLVVEEVKTPCLSAIDTCVQVCHAITTRMLELTVKVRKSKVKVLKSIVIVLCMCSTLY